MGKDATKCGVVHNIFGFKFGELKGSPEYDGWGIFISSAGNILIQYWINGRPAPGNYITISSWGDVEVGEL